MSHVAYHRFISILKNKETIIKLLAISIIIMSGIPLVKCLFYQLYKIHLYHVHYLFELQLLTKFKCLAQVMRIKLI